MDVPAGKIASVITYLEMKEPPGAPSRPVPAGKLALVRAENPTVSYYRFLYDTIGEEWLWWERRQLDDEALAAIIRHPQVEVYVLYVDGVPAGYGELDLRHLPDIEVAYFGLMPEFIGRGLGPYLLRCMVDAAWAHGPDRVWLHTCDLDHPSALAVYRKGGFTPYDQKTEIIDDPRLLDMFSKKDDARS